MENVDNILKVLGHKSSEAKMNEAVVKELTHKLKQKSNEEEVESPPPPIPPPRKRFPFPPPPELPHKRSSSVKSADSSSPSLISPPSHPRPEDIFINMFNDDWDIYECKDTKRFFYHNPTSDLTQWKPPRSAARSSPLSAGLAAQRSFSMKESGRRNVKSVFDFASLKDNVDEPDQPANEPEQQPEEKRVSVVRDSIRRSDESDIHVPPGYTELYEKDSGIICYHDNMRDLTWHTALDNKGQLYFYTKCGKSEWKLPEVPSKLGPNKEVRTIVH